MGLISAQPNRACLNLDQSQGHPDTPSAPQVSTKNTCQAGLPLERGGPTLVKDLQQKSQTCPTPPNLPLHSQTQSPTQSSPCTLKCLQSNQLRTQKEAPTGSDGWLAQPTATFWEAIAQPTVCSLISDQCSVPGNSGKKPRWHH